MRAVSDRKWFPRIIFFLCFSLSLSLSLSLVFLLLLFASDNFVDRLSRF